MAIIRAIIAAAHTLNLTVVAEGMESDEQLTLLESNCCDQGQGHLVSHPMPAANTTAFLREAGGAGSGDTPTASAGPSGAPEGGSE